MKLPIVTILFVISSAAAYYAMCQNSVGSNLSPSEIDTIWKQVPDKQKKKIIAEHKKREKEYCVIFEEFVRV